MDTNKIVSKNIVFDLDELTNRYENDSYMMGRLQTYLANLPNWLDNENKKHKERISRFNELSMEQQNFFMIFLSQHPYYYMPYNNIYYEYDGKTYKVISEDDIYYKLLSTITEEGKLMPWKYKTKQCIIKQIRDRLLIKSTPETATIQEVIAYLLTIFETKIEVKYFLTIIGDCIFKKNSDMGLLYFITSNIKKLVSTIDTISYVTTGNSIMSNFILKYHENHDLTKYRLLRTNNQDISYDITKDVLNKIGINLICVACHYSDRYGSADKYLITKTTDQSFMSYVYYLSNNSLTNIITDFITKCLEPTADNTTEYNISWKNMYYIWKCFLSDVGIPSIIYSEKLKNILKDKIPHTLSNGDITFINITSQYLPSVKCFLTFWERYIVVTNNQNMDDEYEIDELLSMFKSSDSKNLNTNITENIFIKMISHFYPNTEIIDNKYVLGIQCTLWDKTIDIDNALELYKENCININKNKNKGEISSSLLMSSELLISIDEIYDKYKNYNQSKNIVNKTRSLVVSKQFFEKYIQYKLEDYVQFDKFVSSKWINE